MVVSAMGQDILAFPLMHSGAVMMLRQRGHFIIIAAASQDRSWTNAQNPQDD